jgi:hypothetical protein
MPKKSPLQYANMAITQYNRIADAMRELYGIQVGLKQDFLRLHLKGAGYYRAMDEEEAKILYDILTAATEDLNIVLHDLAEVRDLKKIL